MWPPAGRCSGNLAADGCKLTFLGLMLACGFRVVLLVHDEIVVEVPETDDLDTRAKEMRQVMVEQMQRVCPNVRVEVELAASYCWSKKAKEVRTADGPLVPWFEPAKKPTRNST
jgi:hypothetical protein